MDNVTNCIDNLACTSWKHWANEISQMPLSDTTTYIVHEKFVNDCEYSGI